VNIDLSPEAAEYGDAARQAIMAAGDDQRLLDAALADLGAWDLDPRGDADDLEASAALCRAAGYCGTAYPLARRLAGAADEPAAPLPVPLAPDAAVLDPLGLVLPCWTLLGMLDRAIDLTVEHVKARQQFGQPLAQFQGVQFQLTEAEVERSGVQVLALYALWSIQAKNPEATEDALALRMAALEGAEVTFRVAHQLHGAMGFCDESPLSWLSRRSQPIRRAPFGLSATRALLTRRAGRHGLTGLFND
jgi:3-oxo-4-pregnene-20-carboxyl-CoA dehydrogenase alpha subunit